MSFCKRLGVLVILVAVIMSSGCPGKEKTLIKNIVTNFGHPPKITVFMNETGAKKKMDVEKYLVGVVAGEMKPDWPLNAYAAQAILARTFTMEFLSRGGTRKLHGTDISTDEKEAQAYNAANIRPIIREAVEKTRGQVLTYKKHYIKAWYHASSGGITAYAKEGLGYKGKEPPYISSVKSPETKYTPKEELYWQTTLTSAEINAALRKMNLKEIGQVRKLEILKRTRTQRAVLLRFTGDKGSEEVNGAGFRVSYGPKKLRSIWISDEMETSPAGIKIKGRGFGHGVGLSQWGAYELAKQNWSPQRIIKHYYPKTDVSKIW
jgi:stage II sporulation protein D